MMKPPTDPSIRGLASGLGRRLAPLLLAAALLLPPSGAVAPLVGQEPGPAQERTRDVLARAQGLLQRGSAAEAVELVAPLAESEPDNPRVWIVYASALRASAQLEDAADAFRRAATHDASRPRALYGLGITMALLERTDEAFDALEDAAATGRVNMTDLDLSPAAERLRGDPRWHDLMPSAEDFADPFGEDVRILQEWVGEARGDQFGWIARNVGDLDGDGIADVATSAPTHGGGDGKIYAFSSRTGEELWSVRGREGENLGLGIESAGDANADGVPDVVAGAPFGDRVLVIDGRSGAVLHELSAPEPGEAFGRKVADAGDLDGDGHDDVLLGAPANDAGGEDAGRAYVFGGRDGRLLHAFTGEAAGDQFGSAVGAGSVAPPADGRSGDRLLLVGAPNAGANDGGRVYVFRGMTEAPAFVIESDATGSRLGGMFVSTVGDLDGDGVNDVYASDWSNGALGPQTGRVYLHSGRDGRRLATLTGEAPGDGFGIGTADVGDVDGDGTPDLLIGAWQHGSGAPSGGRTYLYSGLSPEPVRVITGVVAGETYGFDTTGLGDVDGDGTPDFLVTSAWSAIRGGHSGRIFILSGQPAGG